MVFLNAFFSKNLYFFFGNMIFFYYALWIVKPSRAPEKLKLISDVLLSIVYMRRLNDKRILCPEWIPGPHSNQLRTKAKLISSEFVTENSIPRKCIFRLCPFLKITLSHAFALKNLISSRKIFVQFQNWVIKTNCFYVWFGLTLKIWIRIYLKLPIFPFTLWQTICARITSKDEIGFTENVAASHEFANSFPLLFGRERRATAGWGGGLYWRWCYNVIWRWRLTQIIVAAQCIATETITVYTPNVAGRQQKQIRRLLITAAQKNDTYAQHISDKLVLYCTFVRFVCVQHRAQHTHIRRIMHASVCICAQRIPHFIHKELHK